MTNEEAIKRLKEVQLAFNSNWVDYGGINEAFEKAYKALKESRQGKWEHIIEEDNDVECPFCGFQEDGVYNNFCPKCGADMRGTFEE